jgi:hypothetical protein
MRFLSSKGWKEPSKPASVLVVGSRAMTSAVLTRVLAQGELLGEQGVDGFKRSHFARSRRRTSRRGSR